MDRRTFLTWAGLGAIATSLPVALAACSSPNSTSLGGESQATSPEVAADDFISVGSVTHLVGSNAISESQFAGGSGLLIVFKEGDNIVALDAKCPHAGCPVEWNGTELICPCHASKFSADGSRISGPATEGLNRFEAKVEGDQVLVKAS